MAMEFVGPYQIAKLRADENVSRVGDDAIRAASITAGIEQARGEAQEAAALDATSKAEAVSRQAAARANALAQQTALQSAQTLASAKQYTADTLSTSHLDRDVDGTPYFRQGSMTLSIHTDIDGNPFFLDN